MRERGQSRRVTLEHRDEGEPTPPSAGRESVERRLPVAISLETSPAGPKRATDTPQLRDKYGAQVWMPNPARGVHRRLLQSIFGALPAAGAYDPPARSSVVGLGA